MGVVVATSTAGGSAFEKIEQPEATRDSRRMRLPIKTK
jgi:hypothetical protein